MRADLFGARIRQARLPARAGAGDEGLACLFGHQLDGLVDPLHPLHHLAEVELGAGAAYAEFGRALHMRQELGRADQRLRRHAAGVHTRAAERATLETRISELRQFERDYRSQLRGYIEGQLRELDEKSTSTDSTPVSAIGL